MHPVSIMSEGPGARGLVKGRTKARKIPKTSETSETENPLVSLPPIPYTSVTKLNSKPETQSVVSEHLFRNDTNRRNKIPDCDVNCDSKDENDHELDINIQSKIENSSNEGNMFVNNLEAVVRELRLGSIDESQPIKNISSTKINSLSGSDRSDGTSHFNQSVQDVKEKLSPTKELKRACLSNSFSESVLQLLPENHEADFTPESAYEEDWPSDGNVNRRRIGSIGGDSSYSRRSSSNAGDSDSILEPGESASRRASSGVGSTDGQSVYSRSQSMEDEPGDSVSRRPSSNTCEGDDAIEDSSRVVVREKNKQSRQESVFGSKESLSRRTSGGTNSEVLDSHDRLLRRDSLLEAVLAAKRSGWRNLTRSESLDSSTSLTSSLNSSLASDTSGCPCDDCLLGLTQPPRPKKVRCCLLNFQTIVTEIFIVTRSCIP